MPPHLVQPCYVVALGQALIGGLIYDDVRVLNLKIYDPGKGSYIDRVPYFH